ncbi:response regulator [Dyadobacter bucti]|uniref:response regulator n=1 Tax=Dyadobacter bucti TaxID=2572203 RepID=UPI0011099847|nr:response regulator [Dyadobacter bucti]
MNKNGVIIVIEDDLDDQFFFEEAFKELEIPNQRIYLPDSHAALHYLGGPSKPSFLILSDISLPKLSGIELRAELRKNADIALKCVPHLYLTTAIYLQHVIDAYCESAQGFFVKPTEFNELKDLLDLITRYWKTSAASN